MEDPVLSRRPDDLIVWRYSRATMLCSITKEAAACEIASGKFANASTSNTSCNFNRSNFASASVTLMGMTIIWPCVSGILSVTRLS